jgi:DNA modification methylase
MTAVVLRGDARRLPLPDGCVDLICCSPPYFGLRSYVDNGEHYDGQIGSESSPREWLDALLTCTRDWIRVLKPSGSIFVNLGDKYNSAASGQKGTLSIGSRKWHEDPQGRRYPITPGVREKSLLGLPWRYALACMDDLGLILRRDIIWEKLNGLPESVVDRCRSSHEYIFHLTKQPRYYSSVDEIRSPADSPRRAGFAAPSRPALGPELCATVRTDDGPAVARGWCQLGSLQERIRAAVTSQAQGLQVLRPVGFLMRVETPERDYVVDLDAVGGPALDAATAVPLEDALAKLWPAGPAPRLVAAQPAGVLLADVILDDTSGRAEVLDLEVTPVATEGLAARLTLDLHPGRATLLVWTSLGSTHETILPPRNTPLGKLPGSVWGIPSQPLMVPASLGISHFAAFPMELPRRVVLGWSPPGVCTACGEGRRPVSAQTDEAYAAERARIRQRRTEQNTDREIALYSAGRTNTGGFTNISNGVVRPAYAITGYACACPQPDAPTRPAVVLDPFGGTGTTALVAAAYGRTGISVDMSGDYARLAKWRTRDPGERAKAMMVAKPPPVPDGQVSLFDLEAVT